MNTLTQSQTAKLAQITKEFNKEIPTFSEKCENAESFAKDFYIAKKSKLILSDYITQLEKRKTNEGFDKVFTLIKAELIDEMFTHQINKTQDIWHFEVLKNIYRILTNSF